MSPNALTHACTATVVLAALAPAAAAPAGTPAAGLTLFSPTQGKDTYLIDNSGVVLHQWTTSYKPGLMAYLRDDGTLVRMIRTGAGTGPGTSAPGGGIQEHAWDGSLLWDWRHPRADHVVNHDLEILPNGNLLVVCLEELTKAEMIAHGRDPAITTSNEWFVDYVLEVQKSGPTAGNIVWEWHVQDHLVQDFDPTKPNFDVIANRPERLNVNYPALDILNGDWTHGNSVDYHEGFDQLVVSLRGTSEIYVVDHSTTTAEAAGTSGGSQGKGGDILYRWGNPEAYGAGTSADRVLYGQHDANWVEPGYPGAGNLLLFNNGWGRPAGAFSSVEEFTPPVDAAGAYAQPAPGGAFSPAAASWSFTTPTQTDLYSPIVSGAVRLPNGNTLVCSGFQGWLLEVDAGGNIVWQYFNPFGGLGTTTVFKARRYEKYLFLDAEQLSAGTGGSIGIELVAGSDHAGSGYVLVAGFSGTSPGTPLPGPGTVVPINYDALTTLVVLNLNTPPFTNFAGVLDPVGNASASLNLGPIGPSAVGLTAHFAYLTLPGLEFASDARPVTFLP